MISRLTNLDELDPQKMHNWWVVDVMQVATNVKKDDENDLRGHNKSPIMQEPSPASPHEETKPCCTIV